MGVSRIIFPKPWRKQIPKCLWRIPGYLKMYSRLDLQSVGLKSMFLRVGLTHISFSQWVAWAMTHSCSSVWACFEPAISETQRKPRSYPCLLSVLLHLDFNTGFWCFMYWVPWLTFGRVKWSRKAAVRNLWSPPIVLQCHASIQWVGGCICACFLCVCVHVWET